MKPNILKRMNDKYISEIWNIGFVNIDKQSILENENLNIKWLKHNYKDRWFADPFILSANSQEIVLLVEDYYLPKKKGRISKLIIDRNNFKLLSCNVILELASHLSFPAIFRIGTDVYIYPESSNDNNLIIYKYNIKDNIIENSSILIKEPLTDAIITTEFNNFFIFSTKKPLQNKNILDIYSSNEFNGPYLFNYSYNFSDNCARNAGNLFYCNNKLIRPAQDCNTGYGKGIVLQEICYANNKFVFKELKRFYPNDHKWNLGLHTFNVYENLIVTDGRKYYTPSIRKIIIKIKQLAFIKYFYKKFKNF